MKRQGPFVPSVLFTLTVGLFNVTVALFLALYRTMPSAPLPTPRAIHSAIFEPVHALYIEAEVTAYCPCRICTGKTGPWSERTTSLMDPATIYDGVAADYRRALPARGLLHIPGIGIREVDDTGKAMRDAEHTLIDIRMDDHERASRFGRQKLLIALLF